MTSFFLTSKAHLRSIFSKIKYGVTVLAFGWILYGVYTFASGLSDILPESNGLPGGGTIKIGDAGGSASVGNEQKMTAFLSKLLAILQDITAIMSVIAICLVGIIYITSRGDEEKTGKAKKYMIAIIIGLILSVSAYSMIALIDLIPTSIKF